MTDYEKELEEFLIKVGQIQAPKPTAQAKKDEEK
jgi:hypothetical protein